jgi:hypothetical protein
MHNSVAFLRKQAVLYIFGAILLLKDLDDNIVYEFLED